MTLREVLTSGTWAVTTELGPPKGVDVGRCLDLAESQRGWVHAINVTDQQSAVMRLGSIATCRLLSERGFETIVQLCCRDRNRIALQSDILSASALGLHNVLCLSGDYTTHGDHPGAKPVYDLDSVQLIKAAVGLREGRDMAGNELGGSPDLFIGAVVNPGADPFGPQLALMEKKVEAGAQFFQTQAVFDPAAFERFAKQTRHIPAPVMVGVVMLKSAKMADFMNKHIPGVSIPEETVGRLADAEDRVAASIDIAARIIRETKDMCAGVHIMPLGWDKRVRRVLEAAGIAPAYPDEIDQGAGR